MNLFKKSNLKQFYDFVDKTGVDKTQIQEFKEKGFTLVMFGENDLKNGGILTIVLAFYNDNRRIDIFVRKPTQCKNCLETAEKLRNLIRSNNGFQFFIEDGIINLETSIKVNNNIEEAMKKMVDSKILAETAFQNF